MKLALKVVQSDGDFVDVILLYRILTMTSEVFQGVLSVKF